MLECWERLLPVSSYMRPMQALQRAYFYERPRVQRSAQPYTAGRLQA